MLTGKAKEDFDNWAFERLSKVAILPKKTLLDGFYSTDLIFQFAYAIEWFDSVSIVIGINNEYYDGYYFYWEINIAKAERSESGFETRLEATKDAIKRAVEIYNANNT